MSRKKITILAIKLFMPIGLVVLVIAMSACTITNKYGPYSGKVVDKETKEPIEGAAVLIVFSTASFSVGGPVYHYADAIETVTDKNGEFRLPAHRIVSPGILRRWDKDGAVTIFKPGYGCYPYHKDVDPIFTPDGSITAYGSIPEGKYIAFTLPKLRTLDERHNNLFEWSFDYEVPYRKQRNLFDLRNREALLIGEEPWPIAGLGSK